MSELLSLLQIGRFENEVKTGSLSPRSPWDYLVKSRVELTLSIQGIFFRELLKAKHRFNSYSYIAILNKQLIVGTVWASEGKTVDLV